MSDQPEPQPGPVVVVKVAQDLTEIERLAGELEEQALDASDDRLMPGGKATVSLAPVASPEAWEHRFETAERLGRDTSYVADEDDDWEPVLQTLLFWSEDWRREHDAELDGRRPTVASEAHFLRWCLTWAWGHEVRFGDFAEDIRKARARLEDVVHDGRRNQAGVRCFDCDVDLIRRQRDPHEPSYCAGHDGVCYWPHRYCPHDRGGLVDQWVCPSCDRRYDPESYRRAVAHAHFVHADFLPLGDCIERTSVSRGSIQGWASRGVIRKRRDVASGRMTYSVKDILRRADRPDIAS